MNWRALGVGQGTCPITGGFQADTQISGVQQVTMMLIWGRQVGSQTAPALLHTFCGSRSMRNLPATSTSSHPIEGMAQCLIA